MNPSAIRAQLHNYIDNAEEKKLKAIYTMLETEIENSNLTLTEAQKLELDERLATYLAGTENHFTWEETVKKIKQSK